VVPPEVNFTSQESVINPVPASVRFEAVLVSILPVTVVRLEVVIPNFIKEVPLKYKAVLNVEL
jgi:hypothetical protein